MKIKMNNLLKKDFSTSKASVNIPRSKFGRPSQLKTSFDVGQLIPIYLDEVLPGDTFQMDTAFVGRMSTPLKPTMDNLYLDVNYFYVPCRLLWEHWEEFQGANKSGYWAQPVDYEVPQIVPSVNATYNIRSFRPKSLADYFGIPISAYNNTEDDYHIKSTEQYSVSALPFRAYALIWNEFYRDENLQEPCHIYLDDTTRYAPDTILSADPATDYVAYTELGHTVCRVAKFHDYFTAALPEPQKGGAVDIPLGDYAPIISDGPLKVLGQLSNRLYTMEAPSGNNPRNLQLNGTGSTTTYADNLIYSSGLEADLTQISAVNINQLRMAFAMQHVLETDARGGTRYIEILQSHFGVRSPDGRLQRPEFLGGKRIPLYINQVLQTSATEEGSTPQGNVAGFSYNSDKNVAGFTKSFVEHGYIIGLACVRAEHTYQQGINKLWSKKRRFDFYMPEFANIGEQPIYNKELYLSGTESDEAIFGYQEAWADYRYKPSLVTGEMRSSYAQSLDIWHYADYYNEVPVLSNTWIQEPVNNVDRTLAVSVKNADQFIADFYFDCYVTRPMPVYSVPGLTRL